MPIRRSRNYPHLLVVDDLDVTSEYRGVLRDLLYNSTTSPVRRGTHDFWMCFPYPPQPPPPSHDFADLEARRFGRPLLGIADMRGIGADMPGFTGTLMHEAGHAWHVPGLLDIRTPRGEVRSLYGQELVDALNAERVTRPLLVGRQDRHWSSYVNFTSCMEALSWTRTPDLAGLTRWVQQDPPPQTVTPAGLPPIRHNSIYSDLDLMMMGAKRPEDCFPATRGDFYWMEPKLSVGNGVTYFTGLCIAFSDIDFLYFGFYNDHKKLRVERSGTGDASALIDLAPWYEPLRGEYDAMMLRVVRTGTTYLFQACRGNNTRAALTGRGPFLFDGADNAAAAPASGDFSGWQTVFTLTIAETPRAIGIITRTWMPILAEGRFFSFEVRAGRANRALTLHDVPPMTGAIPSLTSLPWDRLVRVTPAPGTLFRRRNFDIILGVPFTAAYDQWASADGTAPRLLTRAPRGDFAFGTSAKVHRSMVTPWAAGAAAGMTMWGIERAINVRDIKLPELLAPLWMAPPQKYRNAFIAVTRRYEELPLRALQQLDAIRRYYDAALPGASQGLMQSASEL